MTGVWYTGLGKLKIIKEKRNDLVSLDFIGYGDWYSRFGIFCLLVPDQESPEFSTVVM